MKFEGMNKNPEVLHSWGEIEIDKDEEIVILVRKHNENDWHKIEQEKRPISFFMQGTLKLIWDFDNREKKFKERMKELDKEKGTK